MCSWVVIYLFLNFDYYSNRQEFTHIHKEPPNIPCRNIFLFLLVATRTDRYQKYTIFKILNFSKTHHLKWNNRHSPIVAQMILHLWTHNNNDDPTTPPNKKKKIKSLLGEHYFPRPRSTATCSLPKSRSYQSGNQFDYSPESVRFSVGRSVDKLSFSQRGNTDDRYLEVVCLHDGWVYEF